jgi:phosphatidylethanolamine-binding protein (PEBP) family uncharacterized protein
MGIGSRQVLSSLAAPVALVVATVLLAGCGGSSSGGSSAASSAQRAQTSTVPTSTGEGATSTSDPQAATGSSSSPTNSTVRVSSPVLGGSGQTVVPIPSRYTCAGANVSLPLRWTGTPGEARELGVFVFHRDGKGNLVPAWSVVGLKPSLRALGAGRLPSGAVVGRNSAGQARYSVCPPKGQKVEYGVFVYAFSRPLRARTGFEPNALLLRAQSAVMTQGLTAFTSTR